MHVYQQITVITITIVVINTIVTAIISVIVSIVSFLIAITTFIAIITVSSSSSICVVIQMQGVKKARGDPGLELAYLTSSLYQTGKVKFRTIL